MVEAYPESLQVQDRYGKLPIHTACINSDRVSKAVVDLMISAFPECLRIEDSDGNLPIHYACEHRSKALGVLDSLIQAYPESAEKKKEKG